MVLSCIPSAIIHLENYKIQNDLHLFLNIFLFEVLIIYKIYPGLDDASIRKMAYFEYRIKVDYMNELAKKEEEDNNSQSNSYKEQMNNMTSSVKMPDMPKMPDMGSVPKISMPSF